MARRDELLDELMKNYKKPEDLIGENGILKQHTKVLAEPVIVLKRETSFTSFDDNIILMYACGMLLAKCGG